MGRNVRVEESRAEMVLGRGVPEPLKLTRVIVYRIYVKATLEGVYTTLFGKLFHVSTTLLLNTFLRIFNLGLCLNSFY